MDCCICLEELNEMVKLHDEHYCCKNCYNKIDKCPLCRVELKKEYILNCDIIPVIVFYVPLRYYDEALNDGCKLYHTINGIIFTSYSYQLYQKWHETCFDENDVRIYDTRWEAYYNKTKDMDCYYILYGNVIDWDKLQYFDYDGKREN